MSNINNNAQTKTNYFDLHMSGLGYLSRMRKVEKNGKSYHCVTVGYRRGKAEERHYTFVDCIIRGKRALEVLLPLMDKINSDRSENIAVYGIMTVSDLYAETYTNKDGKVMPSMKGRLIGLKTLSVNAERVKLEDSQEAEVIQEPVVEAPVIETEVIEAEVIEAAAEEQVLVVKLDPQDPDFKAKKADLQADGYRWNGQLVAWTKAA